MLLRIMLMFFGCYERPSLSDLLKQLTLLDLSIKCKSSLLLLNRHLRLHDSRLCNKGRNTGIILRRNRSNTKGAKDLEVRQKYSAERVFFQLYSRCLEMWFNTAFSI